MEKSENQEQVKAKVGMIRRLVVLVPCLILILLFQSLMSLNNPWSWNSRTNAKYWVSSLSGPISSWIEFSGRTSRSDKAFSLLVAPAILLGIFAHSIKPHVITGVVTVLSIFFWYFWGIAITCMGV